VREEGAICPSACTDSHQFFWRKEMDLLTTAQAAIFLGGESNPLSIRTLEMWRSNGDGPEFVKVGRLVRYEQSALEQWLSTRRETNTCAPIIERKCNDES
jgi:hypothetical protein